MIGVIQHMQIIRDPELMMGRLPQAICSREGQVLFEHAAPLGLSVGDHAADVLAPADRGCFSAASAKREQVCLARRGQAVLLVRGVFGIDALTVLRPLRASPHAVASLCAACGLFLSPAMTALLAAPPEANDTPPEAAWFELAQLRAGDVPGLCTEITACRPGRAAAMLERLAALPPLCTRRILFDLRGAELLDTAAFDEALWGGMAFCLSAFLCRNTGGAALTLRLSGTSAIPTLLLTAAAPVPIPSGVCRLRTLADRFPDAPELALCAVLTSRFGIEVEACADGAGMLGFTCGAHRFDPALLGLKQPIALTCAEAEAKEEEWCRLLPVAGRAGR